MNIYLLIAGVIATFTCIGHFTIGKQRFLKPMLEADFDPIAKSIMHCVFHYISVFLVLSALVLIACAFELMSNMQSYALLLFIALNFVLFAIWQIYIGYFAEVKGAFRSLFQWIFFVVVSGFTLAGIFQG
ncbi:hypothetical protein [Shewanella marisflavi]|uniref:Uncharacterized protein n=1 Tax=Shewanella marisflavi TaxID=260364 RepID=A0AAC9XNK4_9GAMM|nr:hypothetical protein [Shewanella marisflavi]ASJ96997.1 hypothetical protein CFF01_10630 [Shewanella marisflavi]